MSRSGKFGVAVLALYLVLVTGLSVAGARSDPPIEDAVVASPPAGHADLDHARARATRLERRLAGARRTVRRQRTTIRRQRTTLRRQRSTLHRRWHPTVAYALRLASAVSGVSYWQLRSVSWCESRHWPFAANGRYRGLFQLGWSPFGLSPFDPVANALSAALTVRADGSWRQWECKP